jgi:hypothetical protein
MPKTSTIKKAQQDKKHGKSASTQAGEFVHEEIDKVRKGDHGVRSAKQAIAIGLSEARRSGVAVPAKKGAKKKAATKKAATKKAATKRPAAATSAIKAPPTPSAKRSAAAKKALKREGTSGASHRALSSHAHQAAKRS